MLNFLGAKGIRKNASSYLRSWFVLDVVSCLPFTLVRRLGVELGNLFLLKFLKLLRLYRLLRIPRFYRAFVLYAFLIHLTGCLWSLAAFFGKEMRNNWIKELDLEESSTMTKYTST